MTNDDEQCTATKANSEPCEYSAKYPDGKCGIHTDCSDTQQGRESKFNSERAQEALDAARRGKSEAGCGRAAGVSKTTIQRWRKADPTFETESGEKRSFRAAFRRARGDGEDRLIEGGLSDPDVDSSMAKFLLASSFGYVKEEKRQHEHSGEVDGFNFTINANSDS